MRLLTYILVILLLLPVKAKGEGADTPVEPLLLYKAKQDVRCHQWVDSIMNKLTLKEKVGQLFIYTIAPVDTKRNQLLLKDAVDTYKVGGLLFSGGKMQTQSLITIFFTSSSICFSPSGKEDRWLMYMKETWEPI